MNTAQDIKAQACVDTIEDMHEAGCSLASIRARVRRNVDSAWLEAYVEGYLACLTRRAVV